MWVTELSESFRAVTMVDGLPHAASFRNFGKISKKIEKRSENEEEACRRGSNDCHVCEWHQLMLASGASKVSK